MAVLAARVLQWPWSLKQDTTFLKSSFLALARLLNSSSVPFLMCKDGNGASTSWASQHYREDQVKECVQTIAC